MRKKTVILFMAAAVLSVGMIVYGWIFVDSQIGEAVLTEETIMGSRDAAEGLMVGFRADSADNLHWINSFDYSTDETESSFKRGEMAKTADASVYDEIRFTGWSAAPFVTRLNYDRLEGLQEKKIQAFYDEIQQRVMESGAEETGKIKLQDYLDFYPVSFQFQFGNKTFNSESALTGLKVYDERGMLSPESGTAYDEDVALYAALNQFFKIPVIADEYQTYRVSRLETYDEKISLGYETEVEKPLGAEEDFYEFDPIIVIQEENLIDGGRWVHPDLIGGLPYEAGSEEEDSSGQEDGSGQEESSEAGSAGTLETADQPNAEGQPEDDYAGKSAAAYNLKNRMLFIVNNRTAKGAPVDVSQITEGYGIYELPIEVTATASVRRGRRSYTVPNPKPLSDQLAMVYPLDEGAEYVELSLSGDHRYLAVFSVKDGDYLLDMVDADLWTSQGSMKLFPASEKMTYAWGEDGSLAVTNHEGYIAILSRTEDGNETDGKSPTGKRPDGKNSYEILYSGKVGGGLDQAFFDTEMVMKEHAHARYQYGVDQGLAVAVKDGKAALVQNLLMGDPSLQIWNAALACAIIDESGLLYRGNLKSNITDLEYDMSMEDLQSIRAIEDRAAAEAVSGGQAGAGFVPEAGSAADSEAGSGDKVGAMKYLTYMIKPVRNENWCRWAASGENK